jgi:phosphoglycerate dehydrogenase-like enzyme
MAGVIRGAALDVTAEEPVTPNWKGYSAKLDGRLLMSCHSCDMTDDMPSLAADTFLENFGRYMRGEPLHHVVDKRVGY